MVIKPIGDYVTLSQGLAINKGSAHLVSDTKKGKFILPLLRIADMMGNKYSKYISTDVTQNVIANTNDIIYTRTGQIGLVFRGCNGVVHNNSFIVTLNNNELDKDYLFVLLQSNFFRNQALSIAKNSVQPDLTHSMFKGILIPVPSKEEQKNIANVYLTLTSRINNNNKINAELESMAKTLYDYWFLQFEFPNEEGKPYKSSGGKLVWNEELKREIPKGWEVKKVGDILEGANKSKIQVNDANEKGKYPFFTSGESVLAFDEYLVDGFNIFLNTGGNPDIKAYMGKCAYSTDTWCVSAKEFSYVLYYHLLKLIPQFEQLFFAGSGLKHLQKDSLKNQYILLPDDKTLKRFNNTCVLNWKKTTNCLIVNQELTSLRDFLLPLLMNGQVTFIS